MDAIWHSGMVEVLDIAIAMQAQDGVEAMFNGGLGTLIQFGLLTMATFLSIGALFLVGAAGMARLSQDTGRQAQASKYVIGALVMLGCATILGAGPSILAALGFETMQYIDPVNVFQ